MAAIAQLLDGGADVEATRRATTGDTVLVLKGEGEGSTVVITKDNHSGKPYKLEGFEDFYFEWAVTSELTPLMAAASGGHLEAVRLLLQGGAKADGESGVAALRGAKTDAVQALLRAKGALG